jgi:(1->4)-alpha-D-glucan 1-alpha-D-glucosylmutase
MKAPRATYRLQFRREFGFDDAAAIAPYLRELGVSHVYASPYLRARPGSTHGYDIVAHDELNPELGGESAFLRMQQTLVDAGLGQILDFVPNHMGVGGADNPLWLDVLEWGADSRYAGWFDIDWEPAAKYLTEKLLVPVLDDQYGAALEDGKLELRFDPEQGEFAVWAYGTHKLPVSPFNYGEILGDDDPELERLGDAFGALAEWRPQVGRRAQELKKELALRVAAHAASAASLAATLRRFNGQTDSTRRELDGLIQRQHWRASHFRVAGDDINYRRFFNVNDLAGLRVELPEVFEHSHRQVVRLLRQGVIDGLRIDHIDGLLDPGEYLARLRALALEGAGVSRPFYLLVEKILARDEHLPPEWQVEGTTGYEFGNQVLRLLTDARGAERLTGAWEDFSGNHATFDEIVRDSKIFVMKNDLASELNVLARDAARVARQNARTADFTRRILHRALRATIACFPVYRTYLDGRGELSAADRQRILSALAGARQLERDLDPSVFDFLEHLLTGALVSSPRSGFSRHAALRCAMKFQQFSGPVMAKGLEDTAFYRYNRLISHNEVGGDPKQIGGSVAEFHAANLARMRQSPTALLSTATHDTKRGEDVRMRLAYLASIPEEWATQVLQWRQILSSQSERLADPALEYFFYQTLLGTYPTESFELQPYRERLHAALIKAAREARWRSSWSRPDADYESRLVSLIDAALDTPEFSEAFVPFHRRVAAVGARNSLLQTVLKLTAPGIPDIYQGCEFWDLSMVDPDNRRAVDYGSRAQALQGMLTSWERDAGATMLGASRNWQDGRIKLLITSLLLRLRTQNLALANGNYQALTTHDEDPRVCAFLRECADDAVLVAVRRFPSQDPQDEADVRLRLQVPGATRRWREIFLQREVKIEEGVPLAVGLPFSVLIAEPQG